MSLNVIAGEVFGRWTVIEEVEPHYTSGGGKKRLIKCLCECGAIGTPRLAEIRNGKSSSCGCFKLETMRRIKSKKVDGAASKYHPLYKTWRGMRERCSNPRNKGWQWYGGRGIRVCERWQKSFADFAADVGNKPSPKHTLDRVQVDGDYSPDNFRWATWHEQRMNRQGQ